MQPFLESLSHVDDAAHAQVHVYKQTVGEGWETRMSSVHHVSDDCARTTKSSITSCAYLRVLIEFSALQTKLLSRSRFPDVGLMQEFKTVLT